MVDQPELPEEAILKDATGGIEKLRRMGITDFAITTYLVRVREGQSREQALAALLQGRVLSEEQKQTVRSVLSRLPGS